VHFGQVSLQPGGTGAGELTEGTSVCLLLCAGSSEPSPLVLSVHKHVGFESRLSDAGVSALSALEGLVARVGQHVTTEVC